eukprot:766551-Hanusia_phi.AAC.2
MNTEISTVDQIFINQIPPQLAVSDTEPRPPDRKQIGTTTPAWKGCQAHYPTLPHVRSGVRYRSHSSVVAATNLH